MKIRATNFGEARIPLKIILTIIGHGGSHHLIVQKHPVVNSIYAIIVTSLYCIAFGFVLDFRSKYALLDPKDSVLLYAIYAGTAIAGLSRMLSWYYAKTHASWTGKVEQIDETLQKCGSSFDYNKDFNLIIASICIELLTFLVQTAMAVSRPYVDLPVYQRTLMILVLLHPIHLISIIVWNFSLEVRFIRKRFCKANKLLEQVINPFQQPITDQALTFVDDAMCSLTLLLSTRQNLNDVLRRQHVIQIIKHVHLELCAISKELNQAYSLEIALAMVVYFVMITANVLRFHTELMDSSGNNHLEIAFCLVRICTYFGEVMLVNQVCEKVSAEAQRTGQIIHCINQLNETPELRNEIKQFSLQLIQHPLYFSPAGLFILGSKFVVQFTATALTYVTIFLQFEYQFGNRQQC